MELEPIKIKGINKDISPRAVDTQHNRLLVNPLIDALNARYHTSETGEFESVQNIAGTVGYDPGLPAGTNLVIGSFTDREAGRLIFYNYNSNGNHGVYAWNPITNAFTTLIQKTLLAFSNNPRYRITGVGIVQNLLYWTDGLNPQRMINMTRDYSAITDDACINLYKRPPVQGPTMNKNYGDADYYQVLNSSYKTSAVAGNIYQFATRYIYLDNEPSALSLYSDSASSFANYTLTSFGFNGIRIKIYKQDEVSPIVSKVQLLYRKNNSPDWFLYVEKKISDFGAGTSLLVEFYDDNSTTIIPQNEVNKLYDAVPLSSKALATFKNRNFLIADVEGYTVNQSQSFSLTKTNGTYSDSLKEGGNYSHGLTYYDKDMRTPGITSFIKTSIDYQTGVSGGGIDPTLRTRAYPNFLDNNYPSWAKYVSVCRSIEQNYDLYMQIPVKPMFYVAEGDLKDATGATIAIPANMEKYNNGRVYLKLLPDNNTNKFVHIHLQVPENIPFIPDSECFLRIISPLANVTNSYAIPILGFDGQSIICNNINGAYDWSTSGFNPLYPLVIEVFKIKKVISKPLYELAKFFSALPVGSFPNQYDADTFSGTQYSNNYKFKNLKIDGKVTDPCYNVTSLSGSIGSESPSGILNNAPIPESEQQVIFDKTETLVVDQLKNRRLSRNYSNPNSTPSLIPDYRRIPDYPGRPIAYNPNAKQLNRNTTVRFSETFIQDSQVNGLSSFDFLNEYPLPTYRTPVVKLQPASNVLLAIHHRTTTSMYIDESVIQDVNGNISVVKTDKVIGSNRELEGKYGSFGTYHPESVAEWNGIVLGFDIFKGVIWKYDNNGQVPASDAGMKSYFKQLADAYLPYKDTVAILGGIDPYNKEYLITFPGAGNMGNFLAPQTWAFNFVANEWVCRYSFLPDCYGHINNMLVSFQGGKLWVHNQDTNNYNKFYGVKYSRSVTFSINPHPSKVKNYAALQISADTLCEGDNYPDSLIQSFANTAAFPGTGTLFVKYKANDTGKIYIWYESSYIELRETVVVTAVNKEGQSTYMKQKHFDKSEKIFYGPILKDLNTNSALMKAGTLKLLDGKDMLSQSLEMTITNNSYNIAKHYYSNVTYVHSQLSI